MKTTKSKGPVGPFWQNIMHQSDQATEAAMVGVPQEAVVR